MGSSSAVELLRANKAAEALPLLQAEVAARPEDSLSFEYLSLGLAQLQRFPEAETASASAARLSPRSAAIWFNLGNAQREQRGLRSAADGSDPALQRAERSYQAALELAPRWPAAYINLGVAQIEMLPALAAYRAALALEPAPPSAHALVNVVHSATWLAAWRDEEALHAALRRWVEECVDGPAAGGATGAGAAARDELLPLQPWHTLAYPLPARLSSAVHAAHAAHAAHVAHAVGGASAAGGEAARHRRRWPAAQPARAAGGGGGGGGGGGVQRLRVSYVSSDLREEHPVGQLMRRVFALHERRRLRVRCVDSHAAGPAASAPTTVAGCEATLRLRRDATAREEAVRAALLPLPCLRPPPLRGSRSVARPRSALGSPCQVAFGGEHLILDLNGGTAG